MPIEVNFIDGGKGVEILAKGVVTGEEIIRAHEEQIYHGENVTRQRYQIVDRTQCTDYRVTADEIKQIAALDNAASEKNPHIIVAFVAPTTLQYGISRMWQAHVDDSRFTTQIFPDRPSANEWIASQLQRDSGA